MKTTIRLIGRAIRDGSHFGPIRFRAARLASKAKPKDYLGQAQAVFDDFLKRWRYVKDPVDRELVAVAPQQIYDFIMGGDQGIGTGDCDDATVAIGAQMASIGFPVRVVTTAPPHYGPGWAMTHVFPQIKIPKLGWVTVDPVVHPQHGFGFTTPHSRLATWDLFGNILDQYGNAQNLGEDQGDNTMTNEIWQDYAGLGDYYDGPVSNLLDFRKVGIKDFGIYADTMGIMGGVGLMAEVDIDETGRAWTPAVELRPDDYNYIRANGSPYHGMLGLGDNGEIYTYDGFAGFFKKLFRRIKSGVKKVVGAVRKVARKVLKKIPGGKYLLKLGQKVWAVSKKLLRPLAKFVGKYATKLAPIAALIPGYGPAISAALYTAGKVAKIMNQFDVKLTGQKGQPRKLVFKSDKHAHAFQAALKKAAAARAEATHARIRVRNRRLSQSPQENLRQVGRRAA